MREGVIDYLAGGRVRGVLLWNTWEQVDAARALIAGPGPTTLGTSGAACRLRVGPSRDPGPGSP